MVYRLGDQVGAWSYSLVGAPRARVAALAVAAVPLSLAWLANALWLGRRQEALAREQAGDEATG